MGLSARDPETANVLVIVAGIEAERDRYREIALEYERALERIAGPRNSDPSTIRRTVAEAALRDNRDRLHEVLNG